MATVPTRDPARRLVLPLPPSDNHAHVLVARGTRLLRAPSHATATYRDTVGWLARAWMAETGWTPPPQGVKVVLAYWVFWPDRRRRDAGNLVKVLADSLKGVVVADDQYLLPRAMDYAVDRAQPRLEARLWIARR